MFVALVKLSLRAGLLINSQNTLQIAVPNQVIAWLIHRQCTAALGLRQHLMILINSVINGACRILVILGL